MSGDRAMSSGPRIAICVATYLRPQGLWSLIESLNAQTLGPDQVHVTLVIADNAPDASAAASLGDIQQLSRWPLIYVTESERGIVAARDVFEGHNAFVPRSDTLAQGIKKGHYPHASAEYVLAARDGRLTDPEIVAAIEGWIGYRAKRDRMGADYGLHSTDTYPWGRGWLRFGPGSNWRAGNFALYRAVNGELPPQMVDAVNEGMWFGLGCNPSKTSFVQGLGHRDFSDPLLQDRVEDIPIPGQISFGVAGGKMHQWEQRKTADAMFPAEQDHWPIYAQIFESRSIAICAEHGIKSNALEWLVACALVNQPSPEPSQ
ncbi:glycosyltransferase family 2 protein [Ruegeria arenilitoris]|uniref:glycosyltransferase family 2 protein n=1 Tax=Ruegeria arenilitoris TaxID=1173585 RepID=UPI00147A6CF1|nr:glycosyltransferase [Ruegeria arenilitoris]